MPSANTLIIWDWMSGSKLLRLRNEGDVPGSFTIINKEFIVNHRTTDSNDLALRYLDVYRLGEPDGSHAVEHAYPIATLSLPLLHSSPTRRRTRFYAAPPSTVVPDCLASSWYRPNAKLYETRADADHLCVIQCSSRSEVGWLCVPSSTIFGVVKECEANGSPDMTMVSWELWGYRTSWIYHANPFAPADALISGLRTVAGTQSDGPTVIWDCNPRMIQSTGRSAASEHGVAPRVCFPKGMGPQSWDQFDRLTWSPVHDNIFFGDGSLANQPFCASKLPGRGDSGPTMMQGEHVLNIIEPGKIVVSCF